MNTQLFRGIAETFNDEYQAFRYATIINTLEKSS